MRARAILILFLTISAAVAYGGTPEIPATIENDFSPWPEWVAADIAVTAEGQLRDDLLGQHAPSLRELARRNTLRGQQSGAAFEDCQLNRQAALRDPQRTSTITALTTNAAAIVSAKVLATRQGFWGGLPGTMILLDARFLKGRAPKQLFLFYPLATIRTIDGMICANPIGEYAPPQPGDRLLIFSLGEPVIRDDRAILSVDVEQQLVHESHGGRTFAPEPLRSETKQRNSAFDAIERTIRAAVTKNAREE
jgi:hypothetical protein